MTALPADSNQLDDVNIIRRFISQWKSIKKLVTARPTPTPNPRHPPPILPSTTLWLCFLGNISIKEGCPFAMCITPEIHNKIYLYTISFHHFTVWPFDGSPWIFNMGSLCSANFATLNKHRGKRLLWQIVLLLFSKLDGNSEVRVYICQACKHKSEACHWQRADNFRKRQMEGTLTWIAFFPPASILVGTLSASQQQMMVVQFLVIVEVVVEEEDEGGAAFSPLTGCHCSSKSGVIAVSH